jgi:dTMP kinase
MFITFEGVEGAGKSTQARLLAERLRVQNGAHVLLTREPGDGPLGIRLRSLVLTPPDGIDVAELAELFIMLADRAQHVASAIRPALDAGSHVVCDRYIDSSVAYQGHGRGLDIARIEELNAFATGGLIPDRTILLDIDPAVGLARQKERNRMEAEDIAFHQRVRDGFSEIAKRHPERFLVIDAARSETELAEQIWHAMPT